MDVHLQVTTRLASRNASLDPARLARLSRRAARAAGLKGDLSVLITSSRRLRSLNRRYRGKDLPTDVISFPAPAASRKSIAGDIAISAEIAARNAAALGHSLEDELGILLLHGILHLAGFDHESDSGQMARREGLLRRRLGLPGSLIARVAGKGPRNASPPARRNAPRAARALRSAR